MPLGDHGLVLVVGPDAPRDGDLRQRVADRTGLPPAAIRVRRLPKLPRTGSGKLAYGELAQMLRR
jgi:hypothetical protein